MWDLNTTKVAALVIIGASSFVLGILPLRLSPARTPGGCRRHAAGAGSLLAALLAFGAGALLATALVHMLPEAMLAVPRVAPVALLFGFLALYLIDELVQRLLGHSPAAARSHQDEPHASCPVDEPCAVSGSHQGDTEALYRKPPAYGATNGTTKFSEHKRASLGVDAVEVMPNSKLKGRGSASCWGLLLALSIHSIIEGLAVGLESSPNQVLFLLAAVSSHKLVVSFCLGAELMAGDVDLLPHMIAVSVFALGSSAGVGLGMALFGLPNVGEDDWPLLPALQAMAGGTLLYVTLAEVLPRERARAKHSFKRRLLQFASFSLGIATISTLVYCMDAESVGPS